MDPVDVHLDFNERVEEVRFASTSERVNGWKSAVGDVAASVDVEANDDIVTRDDVCAVVVVDDICAFDV